MSGSGRNSPSTADDPEAFKSYFRPHSAVLSDISEASQSRFPSLSFLVALSTSPLGWPLAGLSGMSIDRQPYHADRAGSLGSPLLLLKSSPSPAFSISSSTRTIWPRLAIRAPLWSGPL